MKTRLYRLLPNAELHVVDDMRAVAETDLRFSRNCFGFQDTHVTVLFSGFPVLFLEFQREEYSYR